MLSRNLELKFEGQLELTRQVVSPEVCKECFGNMEEGKSNLGEL